MGKEVSVPNGVGELHVVQEYQGGGLGHLPFIPTYDYAYVMVVFVMHYIYIEKKVAKVCRKMPKKFVHNYPPMYCERFINMAFISLVQHTQFSYIFSADTSMEEAE